VPSGSNVLAANGSAIFTGGVTAGTNVTLGSGFNLTWGGNYGANIPTLIGLSGASGYITFYPSGSTNGEAARFSNSGNLLLGLTSDNGNKFQVFGNTHFSVGSNAIVDIFTLRNNNATDSGVRQLFQNGFGDLASIQVKQTNNGGGANDGILELQTATNSVLSTKMTIKDTGVINFSSMPTSSAGLVSGDVYSNLGILTIVP
jgi:hypothetical protein